MPDEDDEVSGTQESLKVASAGNLMLLQIFSRFLTLFMTQMQIRLTSAEVLGAANIHFELLLGLILTLSRDGFRTALSRIGADSTSSNGSKTGGKSNNSHQSIRNVALLPVPIGICISTLAILVYTNYLAPSQLTVHPQFFWATRTFLVGAVLELLAEPLYIEALMELDTMTRVKAEGLAVAAKSASTLLSLWYFQSTTSLLPFGIGQMCFGATFLLVFWNKSARTRSLSQALRFLVPIKGIKDKNTFNSESLNLSWTMTRQNIVKHALGEGDKIAVARLASLSDQGAYALASNYGSLVARLLYQPLEESSRLTFARGLGNKSDPSSAAIELASTILQSLLSFYILLSLFLITFCPPFSSTLLLLLAGRRWALETSAPTILAVYGSTYLPAMAFNGLLEGFLQACAAPSQLTRYGFVLVAASALFVSTLVVFQQSDIVSPERSLLLASSISTMARAAYCYTFTAQYFQEKNQQQAQLKGSSTAPSSPESAKSFALSELFPHPITIATFVVSAAVTRWETPDLMASTKAGLPLTHLLKGVTCALMCAGACFIFERRTLLGAVRAIRGKR